MSHSCQSLPYKQYTYIYVLQSPNIYVCFYPNPNNKYE